MTGLSVRARRLALLPFAAGLLSACILTLAGDAVVSRASQNSNAPIGQSGNWTLVFNDEFNGNRLDRSRWVTCHWWNDGGCTIETNNELQWYRPENVAVRDGRLVLQANDRSYRSRKGQVYPYTSGMASTGQDAYASFVPHRFAGTFYYAEIRARIPTGQGLWPALWLLPADNSHPPEIDIMEILGHDPRSVYMTVHYLDEGGNRRKKQNTWRSRAPLNDWHIYAVDWQPNRITWFVDGRPLASLTSPRIAIPQEPMYFLANLAVGGDWPGAPTGSTVFPADFEIDFVRIWKRVP